MRLVFTKHAAQRMLQRGVTVADVQAALEEAEVIERYPLTQPHACRLVLGRAGGRPLHLVVADDEGSGRIVVVTVYDPDEGRWDREFRRRR